ncbi:MAG: patatin-like phospholipase family protein, partial [Rhodothermales bacterium]|nr:patatin-like phospholipase family protein [Rhodothermales bacterium]
SCRFRHEDVRVEPEDSRCIQNDGTSCGAVALFAGCLNLPMRTTTRTTADRMDWLRRLFGRDSTPEQFGLLLSGGGARAAYQAGVLQYISDRFSDADFDVMTGVSAGAINTAYMSNTCGPLSESVKQLVKGWSEIRADNVFEPESSFSFLRSLMFKREEDEDWSGRALLDTTPLRAFLHDQLDVEDGQLACIARKIAEERLRAVAVVTTNYATGQTVTWVQGENIEQWERPDRIGINTTLTVDHIMASAALPLLFPAIRIGDGYYGDGGIRLAAPLAPLVHLGCTRVLVISTRYQRSRAEADEPAVSGYPPTSRIFGVLMNAVFLDALDQDARTMDRINALLDELPPRKRLGMRPIRLLVIRPSVDIGRLAGEFKADLDGVMGVLSGGIGGNSKSPDWLSMMMFDPAYVNRLIELGYEDARRQHSEIDGFLHSEDRLPPRRETSHAPAR